MKANYRQIGDTYTVECWVWNGLPNDARPVTGYFFSRGKNNDSLAKGDHLGIGGSSPEASAGKLIFNNGNESKQRLVGKTQLELKSWHHIAFVRASGLVTVYLNGQTTPEIEGQAKVTYSLDEMEWFHWRTQRRYRSLGRQSRRSCALRPSLDGRRDCDSLPSGVLTDRRMQCGGVGGPAGRWAADAIVCPPRTPTLHLQAKRGSRHHHPVENSDLMPTDVKRCALGGQ